MERPHYELHDGLTEALRQLGAGRVAIAERMSVEFLGAHPDDPAAHLLAATIALQRARYAEAQRWAQSCLALRPAHAPAMLIAGRAARALGDIAQARDWFSRASEAEPDRPEPAFLRCIAQLECGDPAAQDSLARIIRKFPRDSQGWSQIGAALGKANQLEAAALAFARAFAASGDAAHAVEQGSALMTLGRVKDAVAALRAALVKSPESVEAILPLARGLRRLGEYREALALLERTAVLRPKDWQIHFNLGLINDDLNDSSAAIAAYRRCVALRPDLPEAQVNLGLALQQAGELKAAKDCYRAALRVRPDAFGRIAQALPSTRRGELWLNLGELRRSLGE